MKLSLRAIPILVLVLQSPILAASSDTSEFKALSGQVATLQQEIAELKKSVESLMKLRPTVTTMMPDISERFHVMHYAGHEQDWAVASHELQVLKSLIDRIQLVDAEKGAMANGFLRDGFNQLEAAIEHESKESFNQALDATVANCNSCHVAAGSPSMKVVLDVTDSLSMRHSHDLGKSKKPGDHKHAH
ncbi:MAG: hypothetical protein KJN95_04765 [Gammaproteobacteria bacterium]|nr:hypothetical protein [Gammaproteobacteria bacterium]